jgi:hypothetical protein
LPNLLGFFGGQAVVMQAIIDVGLIDTGTERLMRDLELLGDLGD